MVPKEYAQEIAKVAFEHNSQIEDAKETRRRPIAIVSALCDLTDDAATEILRRRTPIGESGLDSSRRMKNERH
jgi:hypothetical protein